MRSTSMRLFILSLLISVASISVYADDTPNQDIQIDSSEHGTILGLNWSSDSQSLILSSSIGDWHYTADDWSAQPQLNPEATFQFNTDDYIYSFNQKYVASVFGSNLLLYQDDNTYELTGVFSEDAFRSPAPITKLTPLTFNKNATQIVVKLHTKQTQQEHIYILNITDDGELSYDVSWSFNEDTEISPLFSANDEYLILYEENGDFAIFHVDTHYLFYQGRFNGAVEPIVPSSTNQIFAVIDKSYRLSIYTFPYMSKQHSVQLHPAKWDIESSSLQFSPDGKFLAVIHSGGGFVYETTTWKTVHVFDGFRKSDFHQFTETTDCES